MLNVSVKKRSNDVARSQFSDNVVLEKESLEKFPLSPLPGFSSTSSTNKKYHSSYSGSKFSDIIKFTPTNHYDVLTPEKVLSSSSKKKVSLNVLHHLKKVYHLLLLKEKREPRNVLLCSSLYVRRVT